MKPTNSYNQIFEQLEQLEARINQLENAFKNTVTFESLVTRLTSTIGPDTKKVRKSRAKSEWTPEEKSAFHAKMVAGRLAKHKARLEVSGK
jgi:hypothetical protein